MRTSGLSGSSRSIPSFSASPTARSPTKRLGACWAFSTALSCWWERLPSDPYAPIMIIGSKLEASLDEKSNKAWLMVGIFELRPKNFFELYVEADLWRRYVETLRRD